MLLTVLVYFLNYANNYTSLERLTGNCQISANGNRVFDFALVIFSFLGISSTYCPVTLPV